ncbi:hypothetical protein AXF42_Ash013434 [Apostasia shenzhenica]|uniref:Uncharacterized protein n=1 Tax=Apostasia shenzhenica TaxID=1088818 RepID=A0A2I0A471_9ASPA|nr:hypothetical protein AXF42_Ash013434 [Apostasia shenzhenica]
MRVCRWIVGFSSVPVDTLEMSKSYTLFLDIPSLPKSEIQVVSRLSLSDYRAAPMTTNFGCHIFPWDG